MNKITFVLLFLLLISCKKKEKHKIDVSKIKVEFTVDRFEKKFYTSTPASLPKLKEAYPFLFPVQTPDSVWINRMKKEEKLFLATEKEFLNFKDVQTEITTLFKHVKYYNANFKEPKIITLITNLDYENRVLYTGEYLFLSLDMYLGKKSSWYESFPSYISQNFTKEGLIVDVAKSLINNQLKLGKKRQFIDVMITEGKKMYVLDCYLPEVLNHLKIGYSVPKYKWAIANEAEVWKYFISKDLLYSTDQNLIKRFISLSPFSKFYLDIDKDSPGQIGVYIGWQIVKSYMKNNNVTLQKMLRTDTEEIFAKSKYKPKK